MLTGLIIGGLVVAVLAILFAGKNTKTITALRALLIAGYDWVKTKLRNVRN